MLLGFLLCAGISVSPAQEAASVWPYRMSGGKMLVDMVIGGNERTFIFDTGGKTALTAELCEELGIPVTDSLIVTDVNSHEQVYPIVTIPELTATDGQLAFADVKAMQLASSFPFNYFGAVGLIGSDVLVHSIVTIDPQAGTITVAPAGAQPKASLRKMIPFAEKTHMPIVTVQMSSGNAVNVLFDTGSPGFFSLREKDFELMQDMGVFRVIGQGAGGSSFGTGGMSDARSLLRVEIPEITVAGTRFNNIITETATPPYSLLGVKLLDYGKVTIDYVRRRFYFEAQEKEYTLDDKPRQLYLQITDGDLVVSEWWGDLWKVVKLGDRVTKINGSPVRKYDLRDGLINGIPELKADGRVEITVLTDEGEKVVVYKEE